MTQRTKDHAAYWFPVALQGVTLASVVGSVFFLGERLQAFDSHMRDAEVHPPKSWVIEQDNLVRRGWTDSKAELHGLLLSIRNAQEQERNDREKERTNTILDRSRVTN